MKWQAGGVPSPGVNRVDISAGTNRRKLVVLEKKWNLPSRLAADKRVDSAG